MPHQLGPRHRLNSFNSLQHKGTATWQAGAFGELQPPGFDLVKQLQLYHRPSYPKQGAAKEQQFSGFADRSGNRLTIIMRVCIRLALMAASCSAAGCRARSHTCTMPPSAVLLTFGVLLSSAVGRLRCTPGREGSADCCSENLSICRITMCGAVARSEGEKLTRQLRIVHPAVLRTSTTC